MVLVGHALLGTQGKVLSIDAGFCAILQTRAEALVGHSVLDVTLPEDRGTCAMLMRTLAATRQPFQVSKRYVRADGSPVWVTNTVSIIELGDSPPMLVSTIVPIDAPGDRSPASLLDCARFMVASRRDRGPAFATTIFIEPAWDMMLAAYVAEAEGVVLDLAALSRAASIPTGSAQRWARALMQEGMLERESRDGESETAAYRLTGIALDRFERYLSDVLNTRLPERHVAQP